MADAPLHVTTCGICGQTDDHPKHGFYMGGLEDTYRHMDCCAPLGCDVCAHQIRDADGVKGAELRSHLETKG